MSLHPRTETRIWWWLFCGVAFLNVVLLQARNLNARDGHVSDGQLLRAESDHQLLNAEIGADGAFMQLRRWLPQFSRQNPEVKAAEQHPEVEASGDILLSQTPSTDAFTFPGLPLTQMSQEGTTITPAQWPENFCVNLQLEAPDAGDYSEGPIKAIALIGGQGESGGGTGKCGYFMLCFTTGNALAMGVQCNGGGSDAPLGTTQNLTSFTQHDLSFCYDSANMQATIYVDGEQRAQDRRVFVFPREGQVTLLAGSHDTDIELTEGVTLTSLSIDALQTTTTTTMIAGTTNVWDMNLQATPFALQAMPRTIASQRTAMITREQWPPDFCLNAVISTPATTTGVRAIALVGGSEHCGNFIIFFGEGNKVGMGVQCDSAGSDAALISAGPVPSGTHAVTFCYAKIEAKASIAVDGIIITADDKTWNYPTYGNVSVLIGSHVNEAERLEGVTLQTLSMVQHNPMSPVPLPTDMSGRTDANLGTLPDTTTTTRTTHTTTNTVMAAAAVGNASVGAGGNGSNRTSGSVGGGGAAGAAGAAGGGGAVVFAEPTTTTTTTTTATTIIMEHIASVSNVTSSSGHDVQHTRNSYDTKSHDDSSTSYHHHVEGR